MSAIPQISSAAVTLCLVKVVFSSSTARKTSATEGFSCKNEDMEVSGVKTLWKHMNEIWALFCLNVPSIKCSVDVKRTGFQQWLLVFPQKSAPLRPPRSPLRRMVFSSQRVHSYSGPDWEKNSSSGAALFKHNSFFSPLRSYNWIIFSSVKNKTSENFRFSISLINGWMRRQNDSKFELAVRPWEVKTGILTS